MNVALVTGSAGLIGSESVAFMSEKFDLVIGIDNDLRQYFFGAEASTDWNRNRLQEQFSNYKHYSADIRSEEAIGKYLTNTGKPSSLLFILQFNQAMTGLPVNRLWILQLMPMEHS
jgi:CDP-paratose 2-epimerase